MPYSRLNNIKFSPITMECQLVSQDDFGEDGLSYQLPSAIAIWYKV